MYSSINYTLDVGVFNVENGAPQFENPDLRLPLNRNMLIGRAASEEENSLCTGGALDCINTERLAGQAYFQPRPAYSTTGKLIIPDDDHGLTAWISRCHGELVRDGAGFLYVHTSSSNMNTRLWVPEKGIVCTVRTEGENIRPDFEGKETRPAYLLLGGYNDDQPDRAFTHFSYYLALHKHSSEGQIPGIEPRQYVNITINGVKE